MRKKSTNSWTSLASGKTTAIILHTQLTVLSFFVVEESMYFLSWSTSLSPLWNAAPRFHNQWQCGSGIPHLLVHTKSDALSRNPFSVCGIHTICLENNIWPPSYNQKCHEQFHAFLLAKCWAVLQSDIFSHICLMHKAFHMTCCHWMLTLKTLN